MPLSPIDALVLGCDAGHRIDVNKRGYVSLLPPKTRVTGDSAEMLEARARFFDTGAYAPIAEAVSDAAVTVTDASGLRIAEIGCGTGYYLAALCAALPGSRPLASDLSPAAVRVAVGAVPGAVGVVLDVWQPLPLADASQDVLLSVFAPRNLPEFARVLDTGGIFLAVVPSGAHLSEARAAGLALDVPDGKADDLIRSAEPWFELAGRREVEFVMHLEGENLALLLGMGPSAHHTLAGGQDVPTRVTASVSVLTFRRRT